MLDRTPSQGSFWDSQWIEHLIDKESFEWNFKKIVRPLISDEDFAWAYDPDRGRKAIPPSLIACALILQRKYDLSDRDMERQIRFNLATKYALGLPMDDKGLDHSTLCKFRVMLVEEDQAKLCFDKFREALIEAELIKDGEAAIIDTTHVIADIAIPNTIDLLRMGIKGVLKAAGKVRLGEGNRLVKNLGLEIVYKTTKNEERKEHLVELVHAGRRLIDYLEKSGDGGHPMLHEFVEQLRRILHENTSERSEGRGKKKRVVIEEREGAVPDRLVSPVDPDARHGRKSEKKKFTGYKAQIMENEKEFITAIEGIEGNRHDSWKVKELVDEVEHIGVKPGQLVGDSAYSIDPLGIYLEKRKVKVVSPYQEGRKGPYYSNDCFDYISNPGGSPRLRCPGGYETELIDYHWKGPRFRFVQCEGCDSKTKCTTADNRTVLITEGYFYRQRKKAFNETNTYKDLMKERAKIERKNGQLKNQIGLKRCRYRGLAKFRFQCFFSALVANIKRLITMLFYPSPGEAIAVGAWV